MLKLEGQKFGLWTVIKDTGKRTIYREVIWECKCDCGTIREVKLKTLKNKSKPRSCGCSRKIRSHQIFESNYEKTEGCWLWKGSINKGGYGKFGAKRTAHRIAFENIYGKIPNGLHVCHKCDVRSCVNPAHMFLGTIGDNLHDMTQKGRRACGSKTGTSILNEEKVLEIRKMRLSGKEYQEIAEYFGVCWGTVGIICRNQQWKHVPLGEETKRMPQIRKPALGSKCGSSKLNEEQVREIKSLLKEGKTGNSIAELYHVNFSTISDIKQGRIWKHVINA